MAAAYFLLNSYSYHGMTPNNLLRGTRAELVEVHGVIRKTHDASSCSLHVKDLTRVNASCKGAARIFSKPKMMLNQNNNYPKLVSNLALGRMVDNFVFRQIISIRSYEVGSNRTASIQTLVNHLQETSINHLKEIGVWGDGLGLTKEMCKRNLIWVMTKLQVVVDRYPIWGDVIEIDTWKGAYGKVGMTSHWIFRDCKSGDILIRASCIWLMMNKETRKLSKFPNEVRAELEQLFTEKPPPVKDEEQDARKWSKPDENINFDHHIQINNLKPRWSDLDVNKHVNNAKYIGWILESVPSTILDRYEIASMSLEYHRECRMDTVLQSHTCVIETSDHDHVVDCEHLLQLENGSSTRGEKIMKGRTRWRLKVYA